MMNVANLNVPFSANQQQLALLRLVNWGLKIGLILFATDLFGLITPAVVMKRLHMCNSNHA